MCKWSPLHIGETLISINKLPEHRIIIQDHPWHSQQFKFTEFLYFWQSGSCFCVPIKSLKFLQKSSNRKIYSQRHRIKSQKREAFGRRRRRTVERKLRHPIGIPISNAAKSAKPGFPPGFSSVFGWKFGSQHPSKSTLGLQPKLQPHNPQSARWEHKCKAAFDPAWDAGNDFGSTTFSNHGIATKGLSVNSCPVQNETWRSQRPHGLQKPRSRGIASEESPIWRVSCIAVI